MPDGLESRPRAACGRTGEDYLIPGSIPWNLTDMGSFRKFPLRLNQFDGARARSVAYPKDNLVNFVHFIDKFRFDGL